MTYSESANYCLERVIYINSVLSSYYQLTVTGDELDELGYCHSTIYMWMPGVELVIGEQLVKQHAGNFKEVKRLRRDVFKDDVENLEWYLACIVSQKNLN